MKNYFIIHGFMGSNIENWFGWLKEKIDSDDRLCVIPQFPIDINYHNYDNWKRLLDVYNNDYKMINENSVVIGHSTGSIFALKYLLENKIEIDKLILVSGFNNYFSSEQDDIHNVVNSSYYVDGSISDISNYVNEIVCIYGDNDPYIPQNVLHDFAMTIGAKEIVIHNGGHLNKDSGYTTFKEILAEI